VTDLSGGQRQRVALGRALAIEPQLLLLDEPLSNLDAKVRVQLRAEIKALQSKLGFAALHVTHDREEAMTMADRLVVMDQGRIAQVGARKMCITGPSRRSWLLSGADNTFLEIEEGDRSTVKGSATCADGDRGPAIGSVTAFSATMPRDRRPRPSRNGEITLKELSRCGHIQAGTIAMPLRSEIASSPSGRAADRDRYAGGIVPSAAVLHLFAKDTVSVASH
jgi:ABC-type sulfate/molybdate transport systems ATPase subunit